MKFKIFIISCVVISVVSIIGLLNSTTSSKASNVTILTNDIITPTPTVQEPTIVETPIKPNLELIDKDVLYNNKSTYITGHIKNNSVYDYDSVFINVSLYNENGDKVGDAIDIINDLESQGTWEFKAITSVDFTKYKVSDIHGY